MRVVVLAVVGCVTAVGQPGEDVLQQEQARLAGTWQLVSAETNGKQAPDEQVAKIRVVIKGDRHSVYFGEQAIAKEVQFQLDPTKRPKTTDDLQADRQVIREIYEVDGEMLRLFKRVPQAKK